MNLYPPRLTSENVINFITQTIKAKKEKVERKVILDVYTLYLKFSKYEYELNIIKSSGRRGGKSKGKRGFSMFKSGRVGGAPAPSNTDSQEITDKDTSLLLDCLVKHRDFGSNFLKYIEDAKNNETCFSACKNDEGNLDLNIT